MTSEPNDKQLRDSIDKFYSDIVSNPHPSEPAEIHNNDLHILVRTLLMELVVLSGIDRPRAFEENHIRRTTDAIMQIFEIELARQTRAARLEEWKQAVLDNSQCPIPEMYALSRIADLTEEPSK